MIAIINCKNKILVNILYDTMHEIDPPAWTDEEIAFSKEMDEAGPKYKKIFASNIIEEEIHLAREISPIKDADG